MLSKSFHFQGVSSTTVLTTQPRDWQKTDPWFSVFVEQMIELRILSQPPNLQTQYVRESNILHFPKPPRACIPSPTRKEWSLLLWWLAPRARLQDQVLRDLDREICHGGADEGLDRGSIGCRRLRGAQLDAKNTGAPAPSLFNAPPPHLISSFPLICNFCRPLALESLC